MRKLKYAIVFLVGVGALIAFGQESGHLPSRVYLARDGKLVAPTGSTILVESGGSLTLGSTTLSASGAELNEYSVFLDIADGSADATYYVVCPHAGTINKIWTVIDDVVSTADITVTSNIGGTGITGGVVTIATAASAAGDVDSATPSALNVITAGAAVNFVVAGGGSGGAPRIHLAMVISR